MSGHIVKPRNTKDAVVMLPVDQYPYGEDCALTRHFQSVLFHYGVREEEVGILEKNEIYSVDEVQMTDPDGDQEARQLLEEAVLKYVPLPIRCFVIKKVRGTSFYVDFLVRI